jgi:hypothetical protein
VALLHENSKLLFPRLLKYILMEAFKESYSEATKKESKIIPLNFTIPNIKKPER